LLPPSHKEFFASLKYTIALDDYYVVHAGFRPKVPLEEQDPDDLVWIRDPFIYSTYDFGKRVIFGHTPFYEPLIMKNKVGIDTGAVYGNRLTCLELPEFRFHSVEP
ncbi:MAG: serine/threonine protein phosphatase, partial [Deltaproteobacteria bacterium]|nr:serine/threonine protein phosphatase [Deltaproteobacteria bacterium]